jgi:hypothetical protein
MIISVSRRCDIPRFRFDWFLERLDAGFVDVPNPYNAAQIRRVSLLPGEAEAMVFWTRDPRPVLAHAEELESRGFLFYIMVTVTGYPPELEPNVPPAEVVCEAMRCLAQKIGRRRVIWRYDPIFLSSITDADFHCRNFGELARRLQDATGRVIISLYDEYKGAKRRIAALEQAGVLRVSPNAVDGVLPPGLAELLADISHTAAKAGMEIQSCAEEIDLAAFGIKAGACIDGALVKELADLHGKSGGVEAAGKDKNQRPHCLCCRSVDIGSYGACPAGCVYCYAQH